MKSLATASLKLPLPGFRQILKTQILDSETLAESPAAESAKTAEMTIFDACRKLGLESSAQQAAYASPAELASELSQTDLPCIGGPWSQLAAQVWELRRSPCQTLSAAYCALWREALDGLVMGVGDSLRYARHSHFSEGQCVDLLYDLSAGDQRWGEVPAALIQKLQPLQDKLQRSQAQLKLLGYAEQTLFCLLEDRHQAFASQRYGFLLQSIQRFAQAQLFPVRLQEVSPQAVWTGD